MITDIRFRIEIPRGHPDLPVILASGYDQQEATQSFVGRGLAAFIQKPFNLETLAEALRSAVERP